MKTVYLAVPYTYKGKYNWFNKFVMWRRCRRVTKCAANILLQDLNVFSPITHSHYIAVIGGLPQLDHEFWLRLDKWYVDRCDYVAVLMIRGWKKSVGVRREIKWALEQGKIVVGINEDGEIITEIQEVPR